MAAVWPTWYVDVFSGLAIPASDGNLTLGKAWQEAEGSTESDHNAWNITLPMPGSTSINSVGVQAYVNRAQGVAATISVLRQDDHAEILAAMRGDADPFYTATLIGQSDWGTDGWLLCRVLADNFKWGAPA